MKFEMFGLATAQTVMGDYAARPPVLSQGAIIVFLITNSGELQSRNSKRGKEGICAKFACGVSSA